jgi:cytosine/creatinine deaminase
VNFDLVVANARIAGGDGVLTDIGVVDGRIVALQPAIEQSEHRQDVGGRLVVPGFVETHIHLDKSDLLAVCRIHRGGLSEAVEQVALAKRAFTESDVYKRAAKTLEKAILHGTTRMRTHVEVDPRVELISLHALKRLERDYAWAIDLELCAFPQEALIDDPGCEDVLISALEAGASVVGGAPYMDRDSHAHIAKIFELARRFDVDIDMHLDFSLDPTHLDVDEVCRLTIAHGWGGRVTVGHVTKLSSVAAERLDAVARMLASAGVALTVLPSTDLFLMGRDHQYDVPRGVTPAHTLLAHGVVCSLSTNNVLNPFTPYGDCSLIRIANLYANVVQIGTPGEMKACLDMITVHPAKLMRFDDYGIALGRPADVVVLDCYTEAQAIAEIAPALLGFKRGRQSFTRAAGYLMRPA